MLSYRLFQLRLSFSLVLMILENQLVMAKRRAAFISIALLFAMTMGLLLSKITAPEMTVIQVEETIAAPRPAFGAELQEEKLSVEVVEARLAKVENLLNQQPTHFDLLINAALLHQALDHHEIADQYFAKARAVNPNHQFFD